MTFDYPDDADGKALRRVAASGSSMSKPMDIDFQIAAPDEAAAKHAADEAGKLGYRISTYGGRGAPWKCQCTKSMVPTYPSLMAAQAELNALARPLGTYVEGWGTYGNRGKKYTRSGWPPEPVNRPPFPLGIRSLLVAILVYSVWCGFSCAVYSSDSSAAIQLSVGLAGLPCCGAVIGAAVGFAADMRHRSMVRQGAIVGAITIAVSLSLYVAIELFALCLMLCHFSIAG